MSEMSEQTVISLEPLTVDDCLELREQHDVGRVAFLDDEIQVLPVNYLFHGGAILFRTAYGRLLDAVHRSQVTFEVDGIDEVGRTGWSVVVHGHGEEVS